MPAPAMMGRLMRNEMRAAASRSKPRTRPAEMVMPDRDTPGARATAWHMPITAASRTRNCSASRSPGRRSATSSTSPNTISRTAISQIWPSLSPTVDSSTAPTVAPGQRPRGRGATPAAGRGLHPAGPRATSTRPSPAGPGRPGSRRRPPTKVPRCRATSNVRLKSALAAPVSSSHPNSQGTRMRCPLDEMGRNSDSPWTMPSTMACRTGMDSGEAALSTTGRRYTDAAGP